jgi:AAA+ ATPase superfamily predicted ATPase
MEQVSIASPQRSGGDGPVANPAFPSILQRLWDTRLRNTHIFLILCGSTISLMEREVLTYRAPLYGRRTGQYLLVPLEFLTLDSFFPHYSPEELVTAYAVLGGTPAYLRQFDDDAPLAANIEGRILTPQTYLYDEARFLLLQEVREPHAYFAILEAMARGNTRPNEIAQAAGLGGGAAAMPYVKTLMDLRLVERRVPATERYPHKSRKGHYRIGDPFFRFWFRFVYPHRSALEEGRTHQTLERHVLPHLDQFTSEVFEEICRRHLWRLELPFVPERVGRGGVPRAKSTWWRSATRRARCWSASASGVSTQLAATCWRTCGGQPALCRKRGTGSGSILPSSPAPASRRLCGSRQPGKG